MTVEQWTVNVDDNAKKGLKKVKKIPNLLKRLKMIVTELRQDPYSKKYGGEPLRYSHRAYSMRLSKKDRVVYVVRPDERIVDLVEIGGHYGDK